MQKAHPVGEHGKIINWVASNNQVKHSRDAYPSRNNREIQPDERQKSNTGGGHLK